MIVKSNTQGEQSFFVGRKIAEDNDKSRNRASKNIAATVNRALRRRKTTPLISSKLKKKATGDYGPGKF